MTMSEYLESLTEIHVKCNPIDFKNIWKDSVLLTSADTYSHRHDFIIPEDATSWLESQFTIEPEIVKYYMSTQLPKCLEDLQEVL